MDAWKPFFITFIFSFSSRKSLIILIERDLITSPPYYLICLSVTYYTSLSFFASQTARRDEKKSFGAIFRALALTVKESIKAWVEAKKVFFLPQATELL